MDRPTHGCCTLLAKRSSFSLWGHTWVSCFLCVAVEQRWSQFDQTQRHPLSVPPSWRTSKLGEARFRRPQKISALIFLSFFICCIISDHKIKMVMRWSSWPQERRSFFDAIVGVVDDDYLSLALSHRREKAAIRSLGGRKLSPDSFRRSYWYSCRIFIHKPLEE